LLVATTSLEEDFSLSLSFSCPIEFQTTGIEIYIIDNTVIMETLETVVVILGNGEACLG